MKRWRSLARALPSPASRASRVAFSLVVLAFCAAPVPGDVGGCGQRAEELDPVAFFASKQFVDCSRCTECSLRTETCERVCMGGPVQSTFTEGCLALVHDGEVCLRALLAASCSDYESFVRDQGASTPSECDFCPRRLD